MKDITPSVELRNAIQLLEFEQAEKMVLLKEQFFITYESLKPVNLLKSTLSDITTSPNLIDNIIGTVIGLSTGYLTKKIFIGTSGNLVRKLFGSILQLGVTNVVAKHPDAIKSFGQFLFQLIFRTKEMNTKSRDRQ